METSDIPGSLPDWLRSPPPTDTAPTRTRRANRWAERTVRDLAGAAREMAIRERWACADGFLQRCDARVKWIATLAILVGMGMAQHPATLAACALIAPLAAAASRVPAGIMVRRIAGTALLFGTFIAVPAFLLSDAGIAGAARFVLRAMASLGIALLLLHTTRWRDLVAGLRGLGIPPLFVAVLERTYLHLYHLPVTAAEMFQARRARTVGLPHHREARRFVGVSIGALMGKAHAVAEATHDARRARGVGGDTVALPPRRLIRTDATLLAAALLLAAAIVLGDRWIGL